MYIYIKHVRCPGCQKLQSFRDQCGGRGLQMKLGSTMNYKLLLSCSSDCAQQFKGQTNNNDYAVPDGEPEVIMTSRGPIPYRAITKTMV